MSSKKDGQILVLMALLSTTMIILFGMVVGIGHLVQAKINLQNAVDLAAMSGASWQARFLNHIGLVNYRMRQNYKFTLYDLYTTQSQFNKGLIRAVNANSGSIFGRVPEMGGGFTFGICQQAWGWKPIPGDGIKGEGVDNNTDFCQLLNGRGVSLPPIIPNPVPSLNPILIAINLTIISLEAERKRLCQTASGQNKAYFNLAMSRLKSRQDFEFGEIIKVLQSFDAAFGGTQSTEITSKSGGSDPLSLVADQTIYQTFVSNLISANQSGVKLEYASPARTLAFRDDAGPASIKARFLDSTPPGGSFANYFERQRVFFSTYAADFVNCNPRIVPVSSTEGTNLGISRARSNDPDESVLIPFSVVIKATVQPHILFWPRGLTPTLVAIGAAKPFGSRVGPPVTLSNYEVSGKRTPHENSNYAFANMSFYPGDVEDGSGSLPGIGHARVLAELLGSLPGPGNGHGAAHLRPSIENPAGELNCTSGDLPFLCLSLAPTLYEGFFWNVYPYPADKYAGTDPSIAPSIISEFPSDVKLWTQRPDNIPLINNAYFLADRMTSASASKDDLRKWHETVLIDQSNSTGSSMFLTSKRMPAFFASQKSVSSSWSPSVDFSGDQIKGEGRRGYQIKLVSLQEVCKEITAGGTVTGDSDYSRLRPYCEDENVKVFH